ncbi:FAD-dependent monooxygenase [Actinokineospora spheciospongiae]|uniref:FAD-dependent monooxygenase n=1 Tax=Actinokineospora spheciospongiae TaxID=909613 RepID=UPI000D70B634|nr:FAD-dependent monooxygenase [Actinokineospora spheciospongiae]PWW60292.1 2-polyprenyl-6-methoxyphenol hydroxylase-like FAD-dependent oxidoreductase [Actinokineospora spheciospongiae]
MSAPSILISGASIAGPALAYWLRAAGWRTTVVERFDGLREAGHNIDVRGAAREVVRRMGIEDTLFASATGEQGTEFLDAGGRSIAVFPRATSETGGATAELEILRGELSRVIHEATPPGTEYLFGDSITDLDDRGDRVEVTFREGPRRSFDVVVVAEGLTSRTRSLVMPRADIRHLGLYMAFLTIPRTDEDNDFWRWFHAPGQRQVITRPDNLGTTRALLAFMTNLRGLENLDQRAQTELLRRTFADVGWATPRILDALDDAPYHFDAIGQVRLPTWSRGRVGLVGDAAHCASPLSGMGTSLALVGAYVLAAELATAPDHTRAFARYEHRMRPYVEGAQDLGPGTPRLAFPRTRTGIRVLHTAVKAAASAPGRRLAMLDRFAAPPADKIELPDFFPGGTHPAKAG